MSLILSVLLLAFTCVFFLVIMVITTTTVIMLVFFLAWLVSLHFSMTVVFTHLTELLCALIDHPQSRLER